MCKKTTATSTVEITSTTPTLMLALELGEEKWKLGFCSAFGQIPLERNIASRSTKAVLAQIRWAKKELGLPDNARVVSCYEAGREGFWLHRFLVAQGIESLIVDSSSIEVKTAKQDRTRVSNRIKSLLANNGLTLSGWKDLVARLARLRLWDDNPLPSSLQARLQRYASDYDFYSERIRELEAEMSVVTFIDGVSIKLFDGFSQR